jgi:hypothetical protein
MFTRLLNCSADYVRVLGGCVVYVVVDVQYDVVLCCFHRWWMVAHIVDILVFFSDPGVIVFPYVTLFRLTVYLASETDQ